MPPTGSNRRLRDRGGIQLPSASRPQDERSPAAARRVITGRSGWRSSSSLSVGTQEAEGRTRKPNRRGIHDHATSGLGRGDRLRGVSIDQGGLHVASYRAAARCRKRLYLQVQLTLGSLGEQETHMLHTAYILGKS